MENPLHIPSNKRTTGLTVYCYRCKTNVSEICNETGKKLERCPFGNRHAFKVYVHVPGTKNERRTKKLDTRDVNEAIKQAIDFEKEVKQNSLQNNTTVTPSKIKEIESENTPQLLIHAFARYIGWLNNEGVPEHRRVERSKEHLRDVGRALELFITCLQKNGYECESLKLDEVDDKIVGLIYSFLLHEKNYSNRSINKHLSYYTSFFKYEIEVNNFKGRNWFESVNREKINPQPESITQEEFEKVLNQISPENRPVVSTGKKVRRFPYYPWLADAYRLALLTGRRGEEVCNMKFNGYHTDNKGNAYITVEDYKVNRIRHKANDEKKIIYVPVTKSLHSLLLKLGLEKYKGTDNYILAPEVEIDRRRIMPDILSRGFSLYSKQLDSERDLTFKSLRKTYISQLSVYLGGNAKAVTQHSSNAVIDKYYLDKKILAKAAQGFEVFTEEPERQNELDEIRNNSEPKQKKLHLEI